MNEYEKLHRWLDEESVNDIPTEELLQEQGLMFKEALKRADLYRKKFFELLQKYGISQNNISMMISELDKIISEKQNEDLLFIYTALATEKGLFFGDMEDEEQKILCWLEQSKNAEKFSEAIRMEKNYEIRLQQLSEFSETTDSEKTDTEEQLLLYQMSLQHDFLYITIKDIYV